MYVNQLIISFNYSRDIAYLFIIYVHLGELILLISNGRRTTAIILLSVKYVAAELYKYSINQGTCPASFSGWARDNYYTYT